MSLTEFIEPITLKENNLLLEDVSKELLSLGYNFNLKDINFKNSKNQFLILKTLNHLLTRSKQIDNEKNNQNNLIFEPLEFLNKQQEDRKSVV